MSRQCAKQGLARKSLQVISRGLVPDRLLQLFNIDEVVSGSS